MVIQPGAIPVMVYDQNLRRWLLLSQPQQPVVFSSPSAQNQPQSYQTAGGRVATPFAPQEDYGEAQNRSSPPLQVPSTTAPTMDAPSDENNQNNTFDFFKTIDYLKKTPSAQITVFCTFITGLCTLIATRRLK
jgi:hypothetical protein